ncbi:MAG: hypothetical protein ACE5GW_11025, partial [Planctomycetota bacterium]
MTTSQGSRSPPGIAPLILILLLGGATSIGFLWRAYSASQVALRDPRSTSRQNALSTMHSYAGVGLAGCALLTLSLLGIIIRQRRTQVLLEQRERALETRGRDRSEELARVR